MPLNQHHRSGTNREKQTFGTCRRFGALAGRISPCFEQTRDLSRWPPRKGQVLIFARANTGSDEPALLPSRCGGRNPPAARLHLSFSWGCQRLVRLRRHRQELARARNLRPERPGRSFPHLHPLTRISSLPGVYFRPLWIRTLSRGISRAAPSGSWYLPPLCGPGPSPTGAESSEGGFSPGRFVPFSGQLYSRGSHRDPGDIFHRARFELCRRRLRELQSFLVGRLRRCLRGGHPVASRRRDGAACDFAVPRLENLCSRTDRTTIADAAGPSARRTVDHRDLRRSARPLDFAELARLSPLPAAGAALCQ